MPSRQTRQRAPQLTRAEKKENQKKILDRKKSVLINSAREQKFSGEQLMIIRSYAEKVVDSKLLTKKGKADRLLTLKKFLREEGINGFRTSTGRPIENVKELKRRIYWIRETGKV